MEAAQAFWSVVGAGAGEMQQAVCERCGGDTESGGEMPAFVVEEYDDGGHHRGSKGEQEQAASFFDDRSGVERFHARDRPADPPAVTDG